MAFTIYSSNDASAPVLDGQAGSLVNLLDKCLVAGYGAKAAAGWSKPYTGANKAVFRQGAGSSQYYLRVLDDASGTSAGRAAFCTGYKTMSDVDTGGGQFPHAAIGLGGTAANWPFRKSDNASAVAVPWMVFADALTFYLSITPAANISAVSAFGDFYSMAPGTSDLGRCLISGYTLDTTSATTTANSSLQLPQSSATWVTNKAITVASAFGGYGLGQPADMLGDLVKGANSIMNGVIQAPNGPDSGFYIVPFYLGVADSKQLRGRLRGYWYWLHPGSAITNGDVFSGTGALAGKTFMAVKMGASTNVLIIEISDTLETNV